MSPIARSATEPYAVTSGHDTITVERLLPGPVERVWYYLTDSEKRAKWFAGGPVELRVGGAMTLTFRNSDLSDGIPNPHGASADGVDHVMHGMVTRCEPPHTLQFTWSPDGKGTETTFALKAEGKDTRLTITQTRVPNRGQLVSMTAGWHVHAGILADLLAGQSARLFWPEHAEMRKLYEPRVPE